MGVEVWLCGLHGYSAHWVAITTLVQKPSSQIKCQAWFCTSGSPVQWCGDRRVPEACHHPFWLIKRSPGSVNRPCLRRNKMESNWAIHCCLVASTALGPMHAHSYAEKAYMYTAHTYVYHVHTTHEFLRWFHEKKSIKAFRTMLSSYSVLSKGLWKLSF